MRFFSILSVLAALFLAAVPPVLGQSVSRTFPASPGVRIEVVNRFGRVTANVGSDGESNSGSEAKPGTIELTATSGSNISSSDLKIDSSGASLRVEVSPKNNSARIDVNLIVPAGARIKVETLEGEVRVGGDIAEAEVRTSTGTIAADVPTDSIKYSFLWTAARPRFLSDIELSEVKEKSAGKFRIEGRFSEAAGEKGPDAKRERGERPAEGSEVPPEGADNGGGTEAKETGRRRPISLNFETARGIILLNIPPNEVSSDLRERPLTNAAKAIIRSGDSLLMEAIRRAAPRYYGDYLRTLPPLKLEPRFASRTSTGAIAFSGVKTASVRVSDVHNRAIPDLTAADFEVLEGGSPRDIISVRQSAAPFNLVLLLDVSGSVDNYVTFIRKAARNFVNTVDARDRVAIVTFNDDVKVISKFTTDRSQLSASLDSFDAGGPTAYYDALAYTLADTLRPLKGERTAIVVLSDGDDNRSFLPFDSLLGSIQESGALIYPLYVPSGLIAASQSEPNAAVDALRSRYLHGELTSKAKEEGERLAKVSGGVYYEISKLSQIQTAYEDIVRQLRTAYEIEYRSELKDPEDGVSPRLRIRTKQPNTYVQVRSVEQRPAGR